MGQFAVDATTNQTAQVTTSKSRSTLRYFAPVRYLLPLMLYAEKRRHIGGQVVCFAQDGNPQWGQCVRTHFHFQTWTHMLHRYFCSKCESLVDATRYTAYNTFPPVLHFSILRFVYDLSSMERKKSKHTINFPLSLDMNQFLAAERQTPDPLMYDLRGVLLHKGASAYHGHYEAQVFDVL